MRINNITGTEFRKNVIEMAIEAESLFDKLQQAQIDLFIQNYQELLIEEGVTDEQERHKMGQDAMKAYIEQREAESDEKEKARRAELKRIYESEGGEPEEGEKNDEL